MNPQVSIIIVHYKAKKELLACLSSLHRIKTSIPFEIIVVDNDTDSDAISQITGIKYIRSTGNMGFGAGNNLGAKDALGEFLFFLNPDTIMLPKTTDILVKFLKSDKKIGIVAPLLVGEDTRPFPIQGLRTLNALEGIVAHSFINTLFPENFVSKKHFLKDWDQKVVKEVDVMPGAAFMIRKDVFEKTGRFDEKLFLYFEEADLARRVQKLGYTIWMVPRARVIHIGQRSTQSTQFNKKVFAKSRFYYFKKHFGLHSAIFVHIITSIGNPFKKKV